MRLIVKNIWSINDATLDFDRITVLAGENDTGKSTISKSLYSIFAIFYGLDRQVYDLIGDKLIENLARCGINDIKINEDVFEDLIKYLIRLRNVNPVNFGDVKKIVSEYASKFLNIDIDGKYDDILSDMNSVLNESDDSFRSQICKNVLYNEFFDKLSNVNFNNKESEIKILFNYDQKNNRYRYENIIKINTDNYSLFMSTPILNDVIYYSPIDNNYYLQMNIGHTVKFGHLEQLDSKFKFYPKGISFSNHLLDGLYNDIFVDFINEKIGEIHTENNDFYYFSNNLNSPILAKTLSSGLKTILLIKHLLYANEIKRNMLIILDEPEINLHPKWQIYLAKIICNLNKVLNVHFLICSHSPYFISAIEKYSKKFNVNNKCKYYISHFDKINNCNFISDCTQSIDNIYISLHSSYEDMEDSE